MTDDQEQLRQHWQQLAEQLGLDAPEQHEPAQPVSPKAAEPAHPSTARTDKTDPADLHAEREDTFVKNEHSAFRAADAEPVAAKAPASDQFVAVSEASAEVVSRPAEPALDERRPERRERRGRRPEKSERGRSSQRRRDSGARRREDIATPIAEPPHPFAPSPGGEGGARGESGEDLPEMNGPQESSDAELPEEIEPSFVDETPPAEERKQDDEADTDDVDTLSDWNVPSWAELIASLYRPER